MSRRTPEQMLRVVQAEATRPAYNREYGTTIPVAVWEAEQNKWVASWGGEPLPDGVGRSEAWKKTLTKFGQYLKAARAGLGSSTIAAASMVASAGSSSGAVVAPVVLPLELRKRLRVTGAWQERNVPNITELEVATPLPSPGNQHAVRTLRGRVVSEGVAPSGGELLVDQVRYTFPPLEGESEEASERRNKRHREREQSALLRLARGQSSVGRNLELEEEDVPIKLEQASYPPLSPLVAAAARVAAGGPESRAAWLAQA